MINGGHVWAVGKECSQAQLTVPFSEEETCWPQSPWARQRWDNEFPASTGSSGELLLVHIYTSLLFGEGGLWDFLHCICSWEILPYMPHGLLGQGRQPGQVLRPQSQLLASSLSLWLYGQLWGPGVSLCVQRFPCNNYKAPPCTAHATHIVSQYCKYFLRNSLSTTIWSTAGEQLCRGSAPGMKRTSGGAAVIRAPVTTCLESTGTDCSTAAEVLA